MMCNIVNMTIQMLLSIAAQNGHEAIAELLLNKKGAVDSKNNCSQTPLERLVPNELELLYKLLREGFRLLDMIRA